MVFPVALGHISEVRAIKISTISISYGRNIAYIFGFSAGRDFVTLGFS